MNQYETVFILTPVLSEAQVKEAVSKFKEILKANNAEVIHEENWGLKKMAYPIKHKASGFYNLLEYKAPGPAVERLEIEFKRDERIIRFLTVRLDKYAIEYSEKRKGLTQKADKAVKVEE